MRTPRTILQNLRKWAVVLCAVFIFYASEGATNTNIMVVRYGSDAQGYPMAAPDMFAQPRWYQRNITVPWLNTTLPVWFLVVIAFALAVAIALVWRTYLRE
jgi:hypothetical protein